MSIIKAKENIKYCSVCCNLSDSDVCPVCSNPKRDKSVIMVVEDPRDMAAYEKTKEYKEDAEAAPIARLMYRTMIVNAQTGEFMNPVELKEKLLDCPEIITWEDVQ